MAPPIAPVGPTVPDPDLTFDDPIDTAGVLQQTCNFNRYLQPYTLTNKDGSTEKLQRVLSVKPRDGWRACGLTFNTHFADAWIADNILVKPLNLPDLIKGPDYSSFTGDLRLNFTPGAGLLLHSGFKAGDLASDTVPGSLDHPGHSGLFYIGMDHFSKDQSGDGFGFFDRSSYSIGLGWANMGDTTVGRLQLKSESDWVSYHNSGWRVGLQLFASETNISFGGGEASNCKGNSCAVRDFYAPTTFYPIRLSLGYFWNVPSTGEDVSHVPGTRRPITTEELTYKLSSRYMDEIVGHIRRENAAKLIGARLAAGTGFQGVENSRDLYLTAGSGMGVFGFMEGWGRGSNAFALGDLMRNGEWWVILPEGGLMLAYGIGTGIAAPLPTADQYWKGEAGAFGDFHGSAAKMGLITQSAQTGLTLLDGLGLLSSPEKGDAWFHSSNALLGVAGFLGIWFARPLAGNGFGQGALANTIFRDTAPFFDGKSGTYDPIKENYPWTQQSEYAVHTTGTMFLSYALNRELALLNYKLDKSRAYGNGETGAGKQSAAGPTLRLDLSLGLTGGMFGASGTF